MSFPPQNNETEISSLDAKEKAKSFPLRNQLLQQNPWLILSGVIILGIFLSLFIKTFSNPKTAPQSSSTPKISQKVLPDPRSSLPLNTRAIPPDSPQKSILSKIPQTILSRQEVLNPVLPDSLINSEPDLGVASEKSLNTLDKLSTHGPGANDSATTPTFEEQQGVDERQKIYGQELWRRFQYLLNALEHQKNFERELQQFTDLIQENPKLLQLTVPLKVYVISGMPTAAQIAMNFPKVQVEIHTAFLKTKNISNWEKLNSYLSHWIQIRHLKESDKSLGLDSILIHKVNQALEHEDFSRVYELLASLKGSNTPLLNDWLNQVKAYHEWVEIKKELLVSVVLESAYPSTNVRKY